MDRYMVYFGDNIVGLKRDNKFGIEVCGFYRAPSDDWEIFFSQRVAMVVAKNFFAKLIGALDAGAEFEKIRVEVLKVS